MPRHIILAASLPAPPARLYRMYLDAQEHTAFTGSPVTIEPRVGATFEAFEGKLAGTILHLVPDRMIVQSWRSLAWAEDEIDSILTLTFEPEGDGGRIELVHVNVADVDFAGVSHGWHHYYWIPWRAYLEG